jgi:hypothetical protein
MSSGNREVNVSVHIDRTLSRAGSRCSSWPRAHSCPGSGHAASHAGLEAARGDPAFEERYSETTLDRKGQSRALGLDMRRGDVWRVTGLEFVRGGEFSLVLNESTVVFGRHGKTPVWALVIPDAAQSVTGRTAASGSMVKSVWMRFHPSKFPELFPVTRVKGPGPATAQLLARAHRAAQDEFQLAGRRLPGDPPTRAR